MLRSDVLWRNGGRLLSVALLGGLALNAGTVPVESLDAQAQGRQLTTQTWLTLENGWLCRSWNTAAGSATSASPANISTEASTAALASIASAPAPANTSLALRAQSASFTSASALPVASALFGAATESTRDAANDATRAAAATTTIERRTPQSLAHCTSRWHIGADGRLISDAAAWTPNPTGDWPMLTSAVTTTTPLRATSPLLARAAVTAQTQQTAKPPSPFVAVLVIHKITPPPPAAQPAAATVYTSPGSVSQWAPVPGHPSYGMGDFAGDPNSFEFGVCTWWAWYTRQDEPQLGTLGVATDWLNNARARGMSVGDAPAVGATVVFQPGVQGAGGSGHVGHVVQLVGGGWFIISEMNFYFNGGGWGRVDYRYVHLGDGVAFIY